MKSLFKTVANYSNHPLREFLLLMTVRSRNLIVPSPTIENFSLSYHEVPLIIHNISLYESKNINNYDARIKQNPTSLATAWTDENFKFEGLLHVHGS